MTIPDEFHDLFAGNSIGHVATLMPDGSPHLVPIWIGYDGQYLLIGGRRSKQRHTNVRQDPRVAMTVIDLRNPYRALLVRGVVAELTAEGAVEFLDRKAQEYLDKEKHPIQDDDRLLMKIEPEEVIDASAEI